MNLREKILLGVLVVLLIVVCTVYIPKWQLNYYHSTIPKGSKDYIELEDKLRKTLIQVCGGLIVFLGLYLTYRRIRATEKQAEAFEEGQITERFTRAIDQIGSVNKDGNKNFEVRLGGIYALERIAKDSKKDHMTIMEVLTAYVRRNAPYEEKNTISSEKSDIPNLPADIQAVLTVIGRRKLSHEKGADYRIDLSRTDLRKANLMKANLQGVNLWKANLQEANLMEANLQKAEFMEANLQEAYLLKANLQKADFLKANLQKANFMGANLQEAKLWKANLQKAEFMEANLQKAEFMEANLQEANFIGANLQEANFRLANSLTVEQLCGARTLYKAKLDSELNEQTKEECLHLLEEPE